MSSSSLQEDRPNNNDAIIPNLDSAKLIREVFSKLLEETHTMQKPTRTDFLIVVESFAETFRWCLEPHKNGIENAIHTYITAHELHHQVQAQRSAIQRSRPSIPIQEYNAIELSIASASQGTTTAMRDIREIIAELCSVKTLKPDLLEARFTKILELFDAKVERFEMVALEGTGNPPSRVSPVLSPALRAATLDETAVSSV